ncbi:SMI1/KNR4 family protein [Mesorhizobium sp. ASY16-5R]|uniref:SMI1/KNR4 family protein n=1 Tax=Mesorhizobium sp. ASY16-5R TaxID=3445772 RepID=UPI003FA01B58
MKLDLDDLKQKAGKWSHLGERHLSDGTVLIGRMPKKGPGAYLHRFFGPLTDAEIDQLETQIRRSIPDRLRRFYKQANGVNCFDGSLFIFGMRRSWDRSEFDAMLCNPFDLFVPAITSTSRSPSGSGLCISRYGDGSSVFIEPDDSVVRAPEDSSRRVLNRWASFDHWISAEFDRISLFFDDPGLCSTDRENTVPAPTAKN